MADNSLYLKDKNVLAPLALCFRNSISPWRVRLCDLPGEVHHSPPEGRPVSTAEVVGYAFTAFGLGYAAGAVIRIIRRAVETLD